ncbi:MAG: [Fe-Fe] hydrogenase large subunit C-terminal domain-containing protein [Eubacterium sp.]
MRWRITEKYVIFQVAPWPYGRRGEDKEFPIGVDVEGRIAEALRRLGADKVFDTKFGADLTTMEESHELMGALCPGMALLPMITSRRVGVDSNMRGTFLPGYKLENISSCNLRHQMAGRDREELFC